MTIRFSSIPLDLSASAAQGFGAALLVNTIRKTQVINPVHGAIALGAMAAVERLFGWLSSRAIPGSAKMVGPIPIGPQKLVSYGLAIATTWKVMQLAGLISSMPWIVLVWGGVSGAALVIGGVRALVEASKSLEQRLRDHAQSKSFSTRLFLFKEGRRIHRVRVIVNPERRDVNILAGFMSGVRMSDSNYYIIGIGQDKPLPEKIRLKLGEVFPNASYREGLVNGRSQFEWMADAR